MSRKQWFYAIKATRFPTLGRLPLYLSAEGDWIKGGYGILKPFDTRDEAQSYIAQRLGDFKDTEFSVVAFRWE